MPVPHTIKELELDSGAKGLLILVPGAQVVRYGVHFRTDSSTDTHGWPRQVGHIVEHIAFGLTTNPEYADKNHFFEQLEKNGAYSNATTSFDGVSYHGNCLADEWERVVRLRRVNVEEPKFDAAALKSERGNVIEELKQYVSNNSRLSWELAAKSLTGGWWMTASESIDDAKSVGVGDLKDFYAATHTAENLRFVIAGDVTESAVRNVFGKWTFSEGVRLPIPAFTFGADDHVGYQRRESLNTISNTLLLAIDRGLSAEEVETMKVVGRMLFSWTSPILGVARERGISYSMSAGLDIRTSAQTIWSFYFPVGEDNMAELVGLITTELGKIVQSGFDEEEFARAKSYHLGSLKMSGQTASGLYDGFAGDYFKRDTVIAYSEAEAAYDTMTPAKAVALLREFLRGYWALGAVGPLTEADYKKHADTFAAFFKGIQ